MAYSIGEAAKAVGVSKSTLSRAVKNGRISAAKLDDGSYSIDPAELHRVYPPVSSATVADAKNDAMRNPDENPSATALLQAELANLREQNAELREERNAWREQAQRLALTDQRPTSQPGFWGRIFGGGGTAR